MKNTLSHLSARAELIARKPEVHPKVFNGKTLFRDLTLKILNFVLVSRLIKCFQYRVKLRFLFFYFVLFKAEKTVSKLILHHMGKLFNIRFGKIRFGIWGEVTFFKSLFYIFTTWKLWAGLVVSVPWKIYHVRIEMRRSLLSFNMCWNL